MKVMIILAVILVMAQGSSIGITPVHAECTEVHFQLYDPIHDPPCGFTPAPGWSIRVTSSPSAISAGTCFNFALDNLYVDVDFWEASCALDEHHVCDIVATDNSLGLL